jgi:N utilization substance protein B
MPYKKDTRHQARKIALSAIFCAIHDENHPDKCQELSTNLYNYKEGEWDKGLEKDIVKGTLKNKDKIDPIIEKCAPQWPLDKIFKIDLVILEMAIYELIIKQEAPDKVIIDEAVELAKEFGNDTSSSFVNGVLGTILENKEKYVS